MSRSSSKAASNGSSAHWRVGNWANSASSAARPGNGDELASRAPVWRLGIALTLTGAAPLPCAIGRAGPAAQQEQLYSRPTKCSKVQRVKHAEMREQTTRPRAGPAHEGLLVVSAEPAASPLR